MMDDVHERRLKGVEAFTFLVALLAASYTILHFLNSQGDAIIHPSIGWMIICFPLWYVSYFAFCSACHYLFDADVSYDHTGSGLAFIFLIIVLTIILDAMDLINLIPW